MYWSVGRLEYFNNPLKVVLQIDQGIVDFYRSLIPKYLNAKPQQWPAHISVVRNETPVLMNEWSKRAGKKYVFYYSSEIKWNINYYWIDAYSIDLEEVRKELGLLVAPWFLAPPPGFSKVFHITLGNVKAERPE